MMTREEVVFLVHTEMFTGYAQAFLDHDQAQRAVIEQQAKEIAEWKTAAQQQNGWYEPLQKENQALREALQDVTKGFAACMKHAGNDDWAINERLKQSQQVLKEVS